MALSPNAQREEAFSALKTRTFDVLVIGGGITGCGIARDAVLRGLSVALVEKTDFAAGTSSKSSKLIHGGLRYLEQLHLGLVFEGVNERAVLQRVAPHLVRPLPFIFPTFRKVWPGLFTLDVGLWLYDALCGFSSYRLHRTYRAGRTLKLEPLLRSEGLTGTVLYYDAITNDARLTLENAIDARETGAVLVNHTRAEALLRDPAGRITGATVQDLEAGSPAFPVSAKVVVNATGPWSDEIRQLAGEAPLLKASKGVHLVVDAARLPLRQAVVMQAPVDRRVMFAIPWGERTVLGTTDTFYEGPKDPLFTSGEDARYVLAATNHYFPQVKLTFDDVISTWVGLRPLIAPSEAASSASAISREHLITDKPGFITIAGGKLTTYRRIAAEVVDCAVRQLGKPVQPSPTLTRPLPGARGFRGDAQGMEQLATLLQARGPTPRVIGHLIESYGEGAPSLLEKSPEKLEADLPFLFSEVDEAIDRGFARTLSDVLSRRVPLLLKSRDLGWTAAKRVATHLAERLSWSDGRLETELLRYRADIDAACRFRSEG